MQEPLARWAKASRTSILLKQLNFQRLLKIDNDLLSLACVVLESFTGIFPERMMKGIRYQSSAWQKASSQATQAKKFLPEAYSFSLM